MIVSITGSRSVTDYKIVCEAVNQSRFRITKIISGGAGGVDTLAEIYAKNHGIEFEEFEANWKLYGRRAGPIRNGEMAAVAEAAIVVWNGESKGTLDYVNKIKKLGKPLYLKQVTNKKYSNHNG
jgi:hypothetical protein